MQVQAHGGVPTHHPAQQVSNAWGQGNRMEVRAGQSPVPGWMWADAASRQLPRHWWRGWLAGGQVSSWLAGWPHWLVALLARELASWLLGTLVLGWLGGRYLASCLAGCLVWRPTSCAWLAHWLAGCLAGWVASWLGGWVGS